MLALDGRKAAVPVAFGEPGEEAVLGATALEILGFVVDPVAMKLVPRNLLALAHLTLQEGEEEQLRSEFNRWAEAGRGEGMEREHLPITLPVLELMRLAPDDRVLDVGCGNGWLCRLIAPRVPRGLVAGMDISDEMVRRAAQASDNIPNVSFFTGGAGHILQPNDSFTKVISVESAYYWPDPAVGLCELHRVLAPGGSAWILINYYRDNPYCHQWGALLAVPTHLLSAEEWSDLLRQARFRDVAHRRILDPSPVPDVYNGRWFRDAAQLREFKREGALLLTGTKP